MNMVRATRDARNDLVWERLVKTQGIDAGPSVFVDDGRQLSDKYRVNSKFTRSLSMGK